ncbi:MAG: hypothetical protein IJI10_09680 [Eubacterium sp.]|nr:hypothetical protein [Eubacterium sp.]
MNEELRQKLSQVVEKTIGNLQKAGNLETLNEIRVGVLGKKGELKQLMKGMKDIPAEERPKFGQLVNEARDKIEQNLELVKKNLEKAAMEARIASESIDVTLPAKKPEIGHRHPNTIALEEVQRIFVGMGYEVVEGPEIEYDEYNFEKLNIPANHPAKDEQDTFYINKEILLRTQTSPIQARIMEQGKLPIRDTDPQGRLSSFYTHGLPPLLFLGSEVIRLSHPAEQLFVELLRGTDDDMGGPAAGIGLRLSGHPRGRQATGQAQGNGDPGVPDFLDIRIVDLNKDIPQVSLNPSLNAVAEIDIRRNDTVLNTRARFTDRKRLRTRHNESLVAGLESLCPSRSRESLTLNLNMATVINPLHFAREERNLAHEPRNERVNRVSVNVAGCSYLDYVAELHYDYSVRQAHCLHAVMSNIHGRYSQRFLKPPDFNAHLFAEKCVKVAQWLVKKEH